MARVRSQRIEPTIIGVDCATEPNRTGLALAKPQGDLLIVDIALCASTTRSASSIVAEWIQGHSRVLLALDAPLGWPATLGPALAAHRAGDPLVPAANDLFRRLTDKEIRRRHGKTPLDVGADRIARTAHAALAFLDALRGLSIPNAIEMAWTNQWAHGTRVIEVYPAATRIALRVPTQSGSLEGLDARLSVQGKPPDSPHARDAIVCALTGLEFLAGRCVAPPPSVLDTVLREGWIWVP